MLPLLLVWHWLSEKVIGGLKIKGRNPPSCSTATHVCRRVQQKHHMDALIGTKMCFLSDSGQNINKKQMLQQQASAQCCRGNWLRQIMSGASLDWISTTCTWLFSCWKAWLCFLTHSSSTSGGPLTSDGPIRPWFHMLLHLGCVKVYTAGNDFT